MTSRHALQLLAPAKNLESGMAAIQHGADAVYIGGPAFGARAAAGNSIADIAQLAQFAHRFSAHVYVALNTILYEDELAAAERLIWQCHEAGVDALIVQDMGVLQLDLPPIALHASTQTDNRTPEKVRFLQAAGFSQAVLARELSLEQIRTIAEQTSLTLECFIHGALCVSYSGQCYISQAKTGRSANRGECAQLCRLPASLLDQQGRILAQNQHLLSLKDMNQTANLAELIAAGVSSFKIEGRLKDLAYVKNVTAWYRQQLDRFLEAHPDYHRASAGTTTLHFQPDPAKTFNRGFTDYFLHARQPDITAFATPKFAGEAIGKVTLKSRHYIEVDSQTPLHNGDGLTFFAPDGELQGLRLNRAEGKRLFPASMPEQLAVGMPLFRNHDHEFDKTLQRKTAERKIAVSLRLSDNDAGLTLEACDEEQRRARVEWPLEKVPAQHPEQARQQICEQLGKLGNTDFHASAITIELPTVWFIPASQLNALRRAAIDELASVRQRTYQRPQPAKRQAGAYPVDQLGFEGNVSNSKARRYFQLHQVSHIADAFELATSRDEACLMTTKHCLRYSFDLCPKQHKGIRPEPLVLQQGPERYRLEFDCKRCEMKVIGQRKPGRAAGNCGA